MVRWLVLRHLPRFPTVAFWCTCVYGFLVHGQLWTTDGTYTSDTAGHVQYFLHPGQGELSGYSLLHTVCGLLSAPFLPAVPNHYVVGAGVMLVVLMGAFLHSLLAVRNYWSEKYPQRHGAWVGALTISVFVVSMLLLMPLVHTGYMGVFTGNPWHNPTYNFARVFTIVAFLSFLRLTDPDKPLAVGPRAQLFLFATAATLSAWSKPSFMIPLLPTIGFVVLLAWWRGKLAGKLAWRLVLGLVPTAVAIVVIRYFIYADPAATNAVVLRPGYAWGTYTPSFAMSVALATAFPLFVLVVRWRSLSHVMLVATVNWLVSTAIFYLLAEAGSRALHANFAWCYMGGLFFLFFGAIEEWFLRPATGRRWLYWLGTVLFALHLLSGGRYLWTILRGGPYL